jgi:hypothetical protein
LRNYVYIVFVLLVASGCGFVQFQEQELYQRYATLPAEEKPESIVFSDAQGTLWHSLFYCGDFKITNEVAYSGKRSIKLSWDKSKGCEWIGFGNSFSNWNAVDMSQDRLKKALTFYVRTQSKPSGSLPIVASLEDFGGGGSYLFIDTKKYLDGLQLDTVWRLVVVPLWDFPVREEEVDIYAIKQMKFQLEGSGSFYLDEIKLIDYSPEEFEKFRANVEAMKPKGNPEQIVFRPDQFEFNAWNTGTSLCQELGLRDYSGKQIIFWQYDSNDCNWAKWGLNWNGWYQINFRGITDSSILEIKYRIKSASGFKIFLEDFRGKSKPIFIEEGTSSQDEWQVIRLPLKEMGLADDGFSLDEIKQLLFIGENQGEVNIEYINIYEVK